MNPSSKSLSMDLRMNIGVYGICMYTLNCCLFRSVLREQVGRYLLMILLGLQSRRILSMINFFNQYGDYIFFAVYLLVSFVLYFRTRNNKYLMEVLNEVKYRLPDYREREPAEAQSFDTMKPVYRLNKQTNELELTDEVIDMQELLNSAKDYCLSACLERFLPTQTVDETVAQRDAYYDDLDIMTQYYDIADE
uniref:Uncharacterized protein n=1 Tax=Dulem virus 82 TaxID=3145793 RepID=A0AAU8B8D1_9VIRU